MSCVSRTVVLSSSWLCFSSINGDSSVPPGYWIINYHHHVPCLFHHTFLEFFSRWKKGFFSGIRRCCMTLLEVPMSRLPGQTDSTGKMCPGLTYLHSKSYISEFGTANRAEMGIFQKGFSSMCSWVKERVPSPCTWAVSLCFNWKHLHQGGGWIYCCALLACQLQCSGMIQVEWL